MGVIGGDKGCIYTAGWMGKGIKAVRGGLGRGYRLYGELGEGIKAVQ